MDVSKNGGSQQPWGFPTKNDHFGVFWGYPYFWKHLNVQKFPTFILCLGVGASPLVAGHVQVPLRRSNLWGRLNLGEKHETTMLSKRRVMKYDQPQLSKTHRIHVWYISLHLP